MSELSLLLEVSDVHLPIEELRTLGAAPGLICEFEYGALIRVPPSRRSFDDFDWCFYRQLREILIWARSNNCNRVLVDRDGPLNVGLPVYRPLTYEWPPQPQPLATAPV
jgi:hypothetical protein